MLSSMLITFIRDRQKMDHLILSICGALPFHIEFTKRKNINIYEKKKEKKIIFPPLLRNYYVALTVYEENTKKKPRGHVVGFFKYLI